jgi:hypothetical protein
MVQAEDARNPSHAQMTRHRDGELEYLDRFQGRAEPLHQAIVDRLVISRESIGVLQHELFPIGQQRVVAVAVRRVVDVFSDCLRARRKSPLQSNGASVDVGDEVTDELSFSYRQLAAIVNGSIEGSDRALEGRREIPQTAAFGPGPVGDWYSRHH